MLQSKNLEKIAQIYIGITKLELNPDRKKLQTGENSRSAKIRAREVLPFSG
jgi:hypothetical protein